MKRLLILILILAGTATSYADGTKENMEVDYKYQFDIDFQIKLAKRLNLNLSPEFRFNDGYDKLLLNGGLSYKTFGCIYWGASYRLVIDRVESDSYSTVMQSSFGYKNSNNYESDIYHRYAFDVTYKDDFGRFTPSFRLRYNNFADDEVDDKEYLRYRAKLVYNIRKCKFTPNVAIEAFQELNDKMVYKMRYSTGVNLKVSKSSSLSLDYRFELFRLEYKNANIFSAGYKCKF